MLIFTSTSTVLKDLTQKNCVLENISLVQQKKGKIGDYGKISDGNIIVKDYFDVQTNLG